MVPEDLRKVYRRQAAWFAGQRGRLLREADIGSRKRVLDLGAGSCETLPELDRRAAGFAVGLDCDVEILRLGTGRRVAARAGALPFPDACFELVLAQMFFMWAGPLEEVTAEVRRVLAPDGRLVASAEPDYGGAIEHPAERGGLSELAARLTAEGADVHAGRKLGGVLRRAGFEVKCGLHPARPLEAGRSDSEFAAPELMEASGELEFLFLPYFWFLATAT